MEQAPNSISVGQLSALARALLEAESNTEKAEEALKNAKEKERLLREETIPSIMQELGIQDITLDTGQKLVVTQEVYASIPKNQKDKAYQWLEDHGFGGLIKVQVGVEYGKGDLEEATALLQQLKAQGLNTNFDQNVHASTLKAFLKEQLGLGRDFPLDLFGARPVWQAKIKQK